MIPALLLQDILKTRASQTKEIDGHKIVIEVVKETKGSLKVPPIQPISSKIPIRLEAVLIAIFLQLKPIERPSKAIRDQTMIRMATGAKEDHRAASRTSMKTDKDRQEAIMALKKEESRTTAGKRMTGLVIEMMTNMARIGQAEEAMMTRTMEIEMVATIPTKTGEYLMMKTKIEMRDKSHSINQHRRNYDDEEDQDEEPRGRRPARRQYDNAEEDEDRPRPSRRNQREGFEQEGRSGHPSRRHYEDEEEEPRSRRSTRRYENDDEESSDDRRPSSRCENSRNDDDRERNGRSSRSSGPSRQSSNLRHYD